MKRNTRLIIAVMLVVITLASSIAGAVLAPNNGENTSSSIELEELTGTESTGCVEEIDGAIEDTGCGSKYFPSE